MHRADHLHKTHRRADLSLEALSDRVGVVGGVGPGAHIGKSLALQVTKSLLAKKRTEGRRRVGHNRGVEGGGHRQANKGDELLVEEALGGLNRLHRARDHDLSGAVIIGDHDVCVASAQNLAELVGRHAHRAHRAACGGGSLSHQLAATRGNVEHGGGVKGAGGLQRADLSVGVAGDHIGLESQGLQHRLAGQAVGADGRLGPLRLAQRKLLGLFLFFAKRRRRKHLMVQPQRCGGIPDLAGAIKGHRQIGTHAHVLTSLTRVQKGDLALGARTLARPHPGKIEVDRLGVEVRQRPRDLFAELVERSGDQRQANR